MISSNPLKTVALCPYVTTYSRDYRPYSEYLRPRTEAKATPAFISPHQTHRKSWPMHQYFRETTNGTYGGWSQPPPFSIFPRSWRPFGILVPSMCEASGVVGPSLTEARTQEVGATTETGPVLCKEANRQLHYVVGGKANALEQQGAKDEPQQKIDVLYEEGVIELSSHVGPACCEDFHAPVSREPLLHLPVAKDAESWDNSAYLRGLEPGIGVKNSTFLQPTPRQCSWCPKCGLRRCVTPPLNHAQPTLNYPQPTLNCTQPSRKPQLTEYQASYCTEWAWPTRQQ
ncbi:uncharacterized protein LOC119482221 isoform X1 [Sebastes umbrosus]|uniref:uncharacterized protein LOC119482221 isoform X1 n=1 Tax=Sebastes umbrosus TaxID=72105 RepID=UPI00189C5E3B|nr:uncharacterized protein LOC119482221 isoform X1 [Sebastes umbrosus]